MGAYPSRGISLVGRSISIGAYPGRGISPLGRSIPMGAYSGRGISTVGKSISMGAYPTQEILVGAYPWLGGYLNWFPRTHILNNICVNNHYNQKKNLMAQKEILAKKNCP